MPKPKTEKATLADLLGGLKRIEKWVREVRLALEQMGVNQPIQLKSLAAKRGSSPAVRAGQCPPPLPPEEPPSAKESSTKKK